MRYRGGMCSALALAAGLVGCTAELHQLDWGFQFETPGLRARAVRVEAHVLRGGCTGTSIYATQIVLGPGTSLAMETPGVLEPGRYGLLGSARDGACVVFAEGCLPVELPANADTRQVVTLRAIGDRPACDPSECGAGANCMGPDSGVDGGTTRVDAGTVPIDAGPGIDAGPVPIDAGPGLDAGPGMDAGSVLPDAGSDAGRDAGPCAPGTADCDRNGSCETDTTSDSDNCGMCGRDCGFDPCISSMCD